MRPGFRTVLCPTDLSEEGDRALDVAYRIVADGGTVHRLHVLEPLHDTPADEQDARRRLGLGEPSPPAARVRTHAHVLRATDVPATIELHARFHHADVIVMSTRGRTAPGRLSLGSVAADLVRRFDLPVVLVREGET
jgi:nucleotide-binding universal stress UspA family protein